MGDNHCPAHEQMMEAIATLAANVGWFKRLGWGIMAGIGSIILVLLPMLCVFFVYLANVDKRLTLVEQRINQHIERRPQ